MSMAPSCQERGYSRSHGSPASPSLESLRPSVRLSPTAQLARQPSLRQVAPLLPSASRPSAPSPSTVEGGREESHSEGRTGGSGAMRGHLALLRALALDDKSEPPPLMNRSLAMRREAYADWAVRVVETAEGRKEVFGPPVLACV